MIANKICLLQSFFCCSVLLSLSVTKGTFAPYVWMYLCIYKEFIFTWYFERCVRRQHRGRVAWCTSRNCWWQLLRAIACAIYAICHCRYRGESITFDRQCMRIMWTSEGLTGRMTEGSSTHENIGIIKVRVRFGVSCVPTKRRVGTGWQITVHYLSRRISGGLVRGVWTFHWHLHMEMDLCLYLYFF